MEKKVISQLAHHLTQESQSRGDNTAALAQRLGIGQCYLNQHLQGQMDTAKLRRASLVAAADYLDVPVATTYLWAGVLQPMDFLRETAHQQLNDDAFDVISRHPDWGSYLTSRKEWNSMPDRVRLFFVLAFEEVTGIQIIDKADKTMIPMEDSFLENEGQQ